MSYLLKHNWRYYEERSRAAEEELLRSMTEQEKFELYCELHELAHSQRQGTGDWEALEKKLWEEKLAARQRFVSKILRNQVKCNGSKT